MDYKEEQEGEFEALESIFSEELTVLSTEPRHRFNVSIQEDKETKDEATISVSCAIQFTFTETYPEAAPLFEIVEQSDNLEDKHLEKMIDIMSEQAEENLGMVMIYTLVAAIQEYLVEVTEEIQSDRDAEKKRKEDEVRAAEEIKYKGTPVTRENFLEWKAAFDIEMAAIGKNKIEIRKGPKKPSGRTLFETDDALNMSDVDFLTSAVAGGGVTADVAPTDAVLEVDESLFQDMEDLDIDLEDSDED